MTKNDNLLSIKRPNLRGIEQNKTTLFMLPALGFSSERISWELLNYFGLVNCYLSHVESPENYPDSLTLILNPSKEALKKFKDFYEIYRTYPNFVTDYVIDFNLFAIVFRVRDKWKKTLEYFKHSRYSRMSSDYAELFKKPDLATGRVEIPYQCKVIYRDKEYRKKLEGFTSLPVHHLDISYEPKLTLFQRNVTESVLFLRDKFLETDCPYFLIMESDVIAPKNFLTRVDDTIQKLPSDWGALGCIYYTGFHDYSLKGLYRTHHVLSGATVYRREAVEKYPFRWSQDNLGAFPDAWWSMDAGKEYSLWNDYDIRCEHLHNKNGTRYSKML